MLTTVFLGVVAFTVVILSLVSFLMVARNYLVASGEVTITINDDPDKTLTTAAGGTLAPDLRSSGLLPTRSDVPLRKAKGAGASG